MYEGKVDSSKHLNLHYDDVERHYLVVTNLQSVMAERYVCKACYKCSRSDVTHVCDQTCSDCKASPPCAFSGTRFPCNDCNRYFRSMSCLASHKQNTSKKKSVWEHKRSCATCGWFVTDARHKCNKVFCANCKLNRDVGHLCYMKPLKDVLPDASDKVLYVFYDLETTQNTKYSDKATLHVLDLVCPLAVLFAVRRCGRLWRVRTMRSEEALVLGRSGREHANLSMQATPLDQ